MGVRTLGRLPHLRTALSVGILTPYRVETLRRPRSVRQRCSVSVRPGRWPGTARGRVRSGGVSFLVRAAGRSAVRAAGGRGDRLRRAGAVCVCARRCARIRRSGRRRVALPFTPRFPDVEVRAARRPGRHAAVPRQRRAPRRATPSSPTPAPSSRSTPSPLGRDAVARATRRPALLPAARTAQARSPDGSRRSIVFRRRAAATGSCITPGRSTTARARCARCG